jgi:hypothetical protein
MTKLTEAQMKNGRDRFLASNPAVLRKVEALTQAMPMPCALRWSIYA